MRYAVAVLVKTPNGIPLVRNPRKPLPHFWKIPGGRSEWNEDPEKAAVREIQEETGLGLRPDELEKLYEENRGNHQFVLYQANISDLFGLRDEGRDGEEVKLFRPEEVLRINDLMEHHRDILVKLHVI